MDTTHYHIDFGICLESNPCQHHVTVTTNTSTMLGSPVTHTMRAPKILDLIFEHNIKISYHNLSHFKYVFSKPEHYELLNKLKSEYDKKREQKILDLELDTSVSTCEKTCYGKGNYGPQITYMKKVNRSAQDYIRATVMCTQSVPNKFTYDLSKQNLDLFKTFNSMYNTFLFSIKCIYLGQLYYPKKVSLIVGDTVVKTWFGNALLSDEKLDFDSPLLIYNDNYSVVIDDDIIIDNVIFEVAHEKHFRDVSINIVDHTNILLYEGTEHANSIEKDGFYSEVRIVVPDIKKVKSVSLIYGDLEVLKNVPICCLKHDGNILAYNFGLEDNKQTTGIIINNDKQLDFEIDYDGTLDKNIMVIGKQIQHIKDI